VFAVASLFAQKADLLPVLSRVDKFALIVVDLGSLAVCVLAGWILIVRKAWAATASRRRPAVVLAVTMVTAAAGASVLFFLGLGVLVAGVGLGH
jgi:hypothetical protein